MPLKSPVQVSSVAEYKKLVQADAKALAATGAKFQSFTKFTFADKTTSPVIFFGIINPGLLETIKKQGTGPATGTASINGNDDIELEVANGSVPYSALANSLKSCGVARKLVVPLGAEEGPKNGAPTTPTRKPGPNGPTIGAPKQRPMPSVPNVPVKSGGVGPGTTPPPVKGTPPTGVRPQNPQPTPSTSKPPTSTPPPRPERVNRPTQPQPQGVAPKTPPPTAKTPPTPKPTTGPGKTAPKPQTTAPNPLRKTFDGRLFNLKPRYDLALKANPNGSFKAIYQGMLVKANKGDFAGALTDAGKLDFALSKAAFEDTKSQQQQNRSERLSRTFDSVKKSYFKPGQADLFAKAKLDQGKTFKAFIDAQRAFETARDEKTLKAMEDAAGDYLKHFNTDYSDRDKKKKESIQKKQICETAIKGARHYRLAMEQDKIGAPPWNEEQEMRSAELYTKLLFEQDDKMATPNDPKAGVNGAFWIEKTVWGEKTGDPELKKTFIFKPADAEAPVAGFPKGGSAAREMLGKSVGDQLQAAMGLDFAFPESTVVSVDSSKIPDASGKPGPAGVPRAGSIQHFAKSKGELKKLAEKDPSILASIPEDEIQKMAVLDLVQLNMDRHSGNFMVGEKDGTGGKVPSLIPIDNGLCLPSRAGLDGRRTKMGPPHNALGDLPGAQKKMAPEMVEKIKQINPDEVVAGMKKSFEAMKKLHPEAAAAAEVSDANFELVKRSILFLQKASTELTIGEIQDAYVSSLENIFDTASDNMEAGFNTAIQNAKTRGPALKELEVLAKDGAKFEKEMRALGWGIDVSKQAFDAWLKMNPAKVVKIYKGKIENPVALKKFAEMCKACSHLPPEQLKRSALGLEQDILTLNVPLTSVRTNKVKTTYGVTKATLADADDADIIEELGGAAKLKQLNPQAESLPFKGRSELMMNDALAGLGGDVELAKIAKLYPDSPLKTVAQKYKSLKAWREYQALGGDGEFYRLGGGVENLIVTQRLEEIKCMKELDQVA